jgi:transposase
MSGKRRRFTPEFRAQSVRLVTETGRPVAHVAAEIGIGAQLLGRWVAKAKTGARTATIRNCKPVLPAHDGVTE